MRTEILAVVTGIALSFSVAAFASAAPPGATEQTVSATGNQEKLVCRYVGHEGMLYPKKYCGTQYAWDKERRRAEQELTDLQMRSYVWHAR